MNNVAILVYEGCWAMSVFAATDFFRIVSLLEQHLGRPQSHAVKLLSVDGADVSAAGGHTIRFNDAIDAATDYHLIVIPPIEGPRLAQEY